jgi:lysophospholipase L1-like esterase
MGYARRCWPAVGFAVGFAVGLRVLQKKSMGRASGADAGRGLPSTSRGGCEMQATRGFAGAVRLRGRMVGGMLALALALAALIGSSVANATQPPVKEQYLGLGDSLAFGYSSQLYHEGEANGFEDPEMFENGYVNVLFKKLKAKAVKVGSNLKLVNDGCPGETTESLIGTNASLIGTLNAALKESQEKNGLPTIKGESACKYQAAWNAFKKVGIGGPLHHPYSGSQLEDALNTIAYAQNVEKKPVTTITLNIGANDELAVVAVIEKEAKEFVEAKLAKVAKEAVEAKLKKVAQEAIEAKVAEAVYIKCSEKAYAETEGEEPAFEEARNKCLSTEGKKLGEEYYAENKAKLEKEGEEAAGKYYGENKAKLEKEGKEAAEKYFVEHEFELGQEAEIYGGELVGKAAPGLFAQINSNISGMLLAIRKAGTLGLNEGKDVDYSGKILYQGGYNPYGKVFVYAFEGVKFVEEHGGLAGPFAKVVGRCDVRGTTAKDEKEKIEAGCFASAIQPGFTSLVKALNTAEDKTTHGGYGACMTFPVTYFNPGSQTGEPERLKALVNMTNGTQTEVKPSTFVYNGPDIHPTPAGYEQLGKELLKATKKCV